MRKVKGFTLIECIVALAVLGIASLTMAQIYASVAQRNKNNHLVNTSLSNQMEYVEKSTSSEAVPFYFGDNNYNTPDSETGDSGSQKPPHQKAEKESFSTANNFYVKIVRRKVDASDKTKSEQVADETYSFPVDVFVLHSRDQNNQAPQKWSVDDKTGKVSHTDNTNYNKDVKAEKDHDLRYKYLVGHKN